MHNYISSNTLFKPIIEEMSFYAKVSLNKFQNMIDRGCNYNITTDEVNIILISKLKDITLSHYIEQPISMLCRKLERHHIEEDDPPPDFKDFDYNFLPECFRHLNKQFDFLCIYSFHMLIMVIFCYHVKYSYL